MSHPAIGASLLAAFVVLCCGGSPLPRIEQDSAQQPEPLPPSADTGDLKADRAQNGRMDPPVQKGDSLPLVSIQAVVAGSVAVGTRVRARGTCIGYSRVVAAGPQPRTRSDWQILADSTAVWVVGSYPQGCQPTAAATRPMTFVFEVAEDTLPALGAQPARSRRYLLHTPRS